MPILIDVNFNKKNNIYSEKHIKFYKVYFNQLKIDLNKIGLPVLILKYLDVSSLETNNSNIKQIEKDNLINVEAFGNAKTVKIIYFNYLLEKSQLLIFHLKNEIIHFLSIFNMSNSKEKICIE